MAEVSCRLFSIAFEHLPAVGLSVDEWCEGVDATPEQLANPKATISWDVFVELLARLEVLTGSPEAFETYVIEDLGYVRGSSLVGFLRFAAAPMNLYRMHSWTQHSLIAGLSSELEIIDSEHLRAQFTYAPDLRLHECIWTATRAMLRGLPTLLGLPLAHVEMSGSGRSRSFEVFVPHSGSLGARIRRSWRAFWGQQPSFAMISAQTEELARRNEQLQAELERREQAEAQLRQAQKLELIGQLAGGVAHDFNNVLMVVKGSLELLALELEGQHEVTELLAEVETALETGIGLTRSLLTFSRRSAAERERCDLQAEIERSVPLLRRLLPHAVTLEVASADGSWDCELDRNQLRTALLNLVVNAGQAIAQHGQVTIELADAEPDRLRLGVIDDGPGMSAEVLAHATEPFFTTKADGEGTGLGLAMVEAFARDCEGEMVIESVPGEGCRISLVLPQA